MAVILDFESLGLVVVLLRKPCREVELRVHTNPKKFEIQDNGGRYAGFQKFTAGCHECARGRLDLSKLEPKQPPEAASDI